MGTWSCVGYLMGGTQYKRFRDFGKEYGSVSDCYLTHKNPKWAVGDKVRILHMSGFPHYTGRIGRIHYQNNEGQLIGSWGQMAIMPDQDKFELVP